VLDKANCPICAGADRDNQLKLMPMAVKATKSAESEEASTEVMMASAAVQVATVPEAPKVDLLNQRRGLYLLSHASRVRRDLRTTARGC
jgi:hypothetical protein